MSTGTIKKTVLIEIECKTDRPTAAITKFAVSTRQARQETEKLDSAQKKQTATLEQNRARVENQTARITAFGAAVDRAANSSNTSASSITSMGSALGRLGPAIGGGIAVLGGAAIAAERLGAESLKVQAVFKNLAFSIEPARRATHGLVSDMTLATEANRLVSLGVTDNAEDFGKLAQAAQALGQKLGTSTESAFESLTAALGRGSSMMLDNLGIVVKQEQAHQQYAEQLGKSVDQLTEVEKAEAFRKVALKAIFAAASEVTVVTDGAAAATQRYRVELENLKSSALGAEDRTLALRDGLAQLTDREIRQAITGARTYGASIDEVKARLFALGVGYSAMPKTVDAWVRALEAASTAHRSAAADVVLNKDALLELVRAAGDADRALNKIAESAGRTVRGREIELTLAAIEGKSGRANTAYKNELLEEQASLRIEALEAEGKLAEAEEARHQEAVRQIQVENEGLKKNIGLRHERENVVPIRRGIDPGTLRAIDDDFAAQRYEQSATPGFTAATGVTPIDPFSRENEEQDAREAWEQRDKARRKADEAAKDEAERQAEKRHKAELDRLEELESKYLAVGKAIGDSVGGLAAAFLEAGDLSGEGFKKVLVAWGRSESIRLAATAVSAGVQAVVAAATFNFPQAAALGAAAAQAAAGAALVAGMTGAAGGFGSFSKSTKGDALTGASFGAGAEAANDRPTVSNSQEDQVALSPTESALRRSNSAIGGAPSGSGQGGPVYNFAPGSVVSLGAIDEQTGIKLHQGIERARKRVGGMT